MMKVKRPGEPRTPLAYVANSSEWLPDVRLRQSVPPVQYGLWGLVVVRLLWLSSRALAAQARGVLGQLLATAGLFTFLYFRLLNSYTVDPRLSEPQISGCSYYSVSISVHSI